MITIVGSINMDIAIQTDIFPKQGETVLGNLFTTIPGGKGANQAVAASRLGSPVQMIGAVGQDAFGSELYMNLKNENVLVEGIAKTDNSTGIANILLHDHDNRIIVVPGANFDVNKLMVDSNIELIKKSSLVMLQLEIPVETIEYILDVCMELSIPVLLNPAPAGNYKREWIDKVTYLTPNETECEDIFGADYETVLKQYPKKIIVTLGGDGAAYCDGDKIVKVPGYKTEAVDTTGAGDTFNGAFAHAMTAGNSIETAVHFANIAASLSVEKFGAQGGMPRIEAVIARLEDFKVKRHGILNRDLAGHFAKLGHTDRIVIADCGLPIPDGVPCIDLAYKLGEPSFLAILDVVLDDLVVEAAVVADEVKIKNEKVSNALKRNLSSIKYVSHEEFKKLTKESKLIIRTGETTPYANVILQCGVIF